MLFARGCARRRRYGGPVRGGRRYNRPVTYAQFLLVFLLLPILVLAAVLRKHLRRSHFLAGGLVCLLAFVYTTPWDNYAAFVRLWTFDPKFVLGPPFWLGYLPLEEYLFYFAEAIFVCVTMLVLGRVKWLRPEGQTDAVR